MLILIGFVIGSIVTYLCLLGNKKLITQKDRLLLEYPPGSGKKIGDKIYWENNPQKARSDNTIIGALLDNKAIKYKLARVTKEILIPWSESDSTHWSYEVEYWD